MENFKGMEISRSYGYKTGNLLDFLYHQNYCKLVGIDLSRPTNTTIPPKSNSVGKFKEDNGTAVPLIPEKQQKNYSELFF